MMSEQKQRSRDAFKPRSSYFGCNSRSHNVPLSDAGLLTMLVVNALFQGCHPWYYPQGCYRFFEARCDEALKQTSPTHLTVIRFRSAFVLCSTSRLLIVMGCHGHVPSQPWISHHRRFIKRPDLQPRWQGRSSVHKAQRHAQKHGQIPYGACLLAWYDHHAIEQSKKSALANINGAPILLQPTFSVRLKATHQCWHKTRFTPQDVKQ